MSASALYGGEVVHTRLSPKRHRLRYRLFQLLIDLDEAPALDRRLKLFGLNRAAPVSLWDRDHLAGVDAPLTMQAREILASFGIVADGAVRLLCLPRVLGYVFNPLSLFYCHRASGELAAVILEVNNTFGERHCYIVEPAGDGDGPVVRRDCEKRFFVSPFLPLEMRYDFRLVVPGGRVSTAILARDAAGAPVLAAAFAGVRRELDDLALARALAAHPLLTLKVTAAIHWEAARLLAKGLRLQPKPRRPHSVTRAGASVTYAGTRP